MGKCLVTDLTGVIQNQELPVYDSIRIKFNNDGVEQSAKNSSIVFSSLTDDGVEVSCEKGYFTDSSFTANQGTYYKSQKGGFRLYVSKGAVILVKGKQKLVKISFDDGAEDDVNKIINWNDIVFCNSLKQLIISGDIQGGTITPLDKAKLLYFSLKNTSISGTLQNIKMFCDENITTLDLSDSIAISGDISELSNLLHLDYIFTINTQIKGTVESLAEAMLKNGRNSGTLRVITGDGVSFDGAYHGNYGYTVSLEFSEDQVKCSTSSIVKTYNGTSWS